MVILYSAIVLFNLLAYKTVKRFSLNMITHIFAFTCACQYFFDIFVDLKYKAYWYGTQGVDWSLLPAYLFLIPPVNLMFLNWFPINKSIGKQILYILIWEIPLLAFEYITLLPEPWGFFHYGWWTLWHSALINPILLLILLGYYKWVNKIENILIING